MKTKLLSICVMLIMMFQLNAQKPIWDYPIKPKTEEWKKLENNKSKVEACQIPEHILQDISTNDLMTLCLQYPLLYDVFAFNNINDGLKKFFSDFNGIRGFSKRENATNNLREQYLLEIRSFPEILSKGSDLFARAHLILKIDITLLKKFEDENEIVLFSGMADAELINVIDSLSYHLIK